jgi:hypothetical protein
MKHKTKISAVSTALAIAGVLAFSGQAFGDQVRGHQTDIQGLGKINTSSLDGLAGRFTFDREALPSGTEFQGRLVGNGGPTALGDRDDLYYGFCLEPNEILKKTETYNVVSLENAPSDGLKGNMAARANDMRLLFGNVYPDFSVAINDRKATALQIAVWEIANETSGTYDVVETSSTKGDFWVENWDDTARADAQTWLTAINKGSFTNPALANLVGLVAINSDGENRQDFVAQVVPIPPAAWLFGSAIVGAVALGRRKKKAEDKA